MSKTKVDLDNLDALIEEQSKIPDELDRIRNLCDVVLTGGQVTGLPRDPFSDDYRERAVDIWKAISGRNTYDPETNEQSLFLSDTIKHYVPSVYTYGSSSFLGGFCVAYGNILKSLNVSAGDAILEYGAGDGQISLALARMGCRVSIIDIEQRYLNIVAAQCAEIGVTIDVKRGEFGDNFDDNRLYDRILFFEAFHHALDHQKVLEKMRGMLKPGGFIVFSGEPIVDVDGPWGDIVPFPWGPRLDGLSARAMRAQGWCELGFQRPYFVELLLRHGFSVDFVPCDMDGRGVCYIATTLSDGAFEIGKNSIIEVHDGADTGWHGPEDTHRWTKGLALLPTPKAFTRAEVELWNPLPFDKVVRLSTSLGDEEIRIPTGQSSSAAIAISPTSDRLTIQVNTHSPAKDFGSSDDRELGVAVRKIAYS